MSNGTRTNQLRIISHGEIYYIQSKSLDDDDEWEVVEITTSEETARLNLEKHKKYEPRVVFTENSEVLLG